MSLSVNSGFNSVASSKVHFARQAHYHHTDTANSEYGPSATYLGNDFSLFNLLHSSMFSGRAMNEDLLTLVRLLERGTGQRGLQNWLPEQGTKRSHPLQRFALDSASSETGSGADQQAVSAPNKSGSTASNSEGSAPAAGVASATGTVKDTEPSPNAALATEPKSPKHRGGPYAINHDEDAIVGQAGGRENGDGQVFIRGFASIGQDGRGGDDRMLAEVDGKGRIRQEGGEGNDNLSATVNGINLESKGGFAERFIALGDSHANITQDGGDADDTLSATLNGKGKVTQLGGEGDDQLNLNLTKADSGSSAKLDGGSGNNNATVSVGDKGVSVYNAEGKLLFSTGEGAGSSVTIDNLQSSKFVGSDGQILAQTTMIDGRVALLQPKEESFKAA